jgi:hypothetical protein
MLGGGYGVPPAAAAAYCACCSGVHRKGLAGDGAVVLEGGAWAYPAQVVVGQ